MQLVKKDDAVNDLRKMIGSENVEDDELVIKLYVKNAVYMEGSAIAVVFPRSAEDVSKIIKYCYKNDVKIYPQGSASEIVGSSTPSENGIVLSLERMTKIKEINIVDSYVIVEPGLKLFELNQQLAKHGYIFPIDPASVKSASIGGAINSGSGGMMGAKYGTIKDWVLGLEFVLPDENGTILRIGSKTTKYRQGYDFIRLIVGSEGTLAIVTEAILKIIPLPENVVTIAGFFSELEDLMKTVIDIKKSKIDVLIMEFVDDKSVKIASEVVGSKIKGSGHFLITSVAIAPEASERILSTLENIYASHGANSIYKAKNQDETEKMGLFDIRRNYYPASIKLAAETRKDPMSRPLVYVEDISVPPSKLIDAVNRLRNLENKFNIPMTLGGHISDGNIHPVIWVEEKDEDKLNALYEMVKEIMKIGIELDGTMSSEHGIGKTKKEGLIMELESKGSMKALELMKEVKKIFDPKNILNPDKMFLR
ncbi:MAG: FAD-binding oxidoreductase [Thermoprotei archaeon]